MRRQRNSDFRQYMNALQTQQQQHNAAVQQLQQQINHLIALNPPAAVNRRRVRILSDSEDEEN